MRLVPVPNQVNLPPENVTVAEALEAAGYATGIFGKWGLGSRPDSAPGEQGFKMVMNANHPESGAREDPKGIDSITRAACAFIEENKDRPFFAFVSHNAIHTPLEARPETLERFQAKKPGAQHRNALYAACLFDLDEAVGALLKKLTDLGLERNTLVIFTSDNGATGRSSQEPLRGAKGSYYEGGIRVPFIARWPGVTVPGSRSDAPVINIDLYPTFLAAAGAAAPAGKTLDGESLLPLLSGAGALERAAIFWHFPGYLDNPVPRGRDPIFRTRPVSVIRKGSWKLHLFHEEWRLDGGRAKIDSNRAVELYDLAADIGERKDLALERRDRREELLDDLLRWIERSGAPLPSEPNPAYDPGKPESSKRNG
jgi:arylsulfatase A-like enzyme